MYINVDTEIEHICKFQKENEMSMRKSYVKVSGNLKVYLKRILLITGR